MRKVCFVAAILGLFVTTGFGQAVSEVEPNDTFATAQVLPSDFFDLYAAGAVEGYLTPGDVDFFTVGLTANVMTTASVFDYTPEDPSDNDSVLGIFAPDGTLFDSDDDTGPGFLSTIHFFPNQTGMWGFAVTGFGDEDFLGDHDEDFNYRLVISIPEPASLSLLVIGGVAAVVRRRRR